MSLTDVAPGEVQLPPDRPRRHGPAALAAGVRALFAAVSGLLLTAGIGVVLWAVTPSSTGGPQQSLRAAVAAFAAGNAMTLSIGRAALTLPPLMITVVAIGLLAGVIGRGQTGTDDRTGELSCTVAAAAVYAAVVTAAGVVLGTRGAVAAEQWWRPFLLAFVVVGTTVFFRGQAWRSLLLARTPAWLPVAVRLGAAGAAGVIGAGAVAVVLGLAGSVGSSGTVQTLAAPGPAAGFGMALLGVAYLPNAVLAGAGYATGVGFHLGAGSYSPFGSSPVELPAVSLLAAAPEGREASRVGMVLLLLPVVLALLVGWAATRRLTLRRDRLLAVATSAVVAGVVLAVLAVVAGGGITGGQWATTGAPPLQLGVVTALVLGIFGAAVAAAARQAVVPAAEDDAEATVPAHAGGAAVPADGAPSGDVTEVTEVTDAADVAVGEVDTDTEDSATADADLDETATDADMHQTATDTDTDTDTDGPADADGHADADSAGAEHGSAEPAPIDATDGAPDLAEDAGGTADDRVPQARREEDVLAEPATPSDAELIEQLPARSTRHVG